MSSVKSASQFSPIARLLASAAAGTVIAQLCVSWISFCGSSPVSLIALMVSLTSGAIIADWSYGFVPLRFTRRRRLNISGIFAAGLLIVFCWITSELLEATMLAGSETVGSGGSFRAMMAYLFPGLVVALITAVGVLYSQIITFNADAEPTASVLFGGFGLLIMSVHCYVDQPLAVTSTIVVLASLAYSIAVRPTVSRVYEDDEVRSKPAMMAFGFWVNFVASGITAVGVIEMLQHVIPFSVPVISLACGISAGALLILSSKLSIHVLKLQGLVASALIVLVLFSIGFTTMADFNLWLSTKVESGSAVILVRAFQLSVLMTAVLLPAVLSFQTSRNHDASRLEAISLTAGLAIGLAAMGRGFSPLSVLCAGLMMHAVGTAVKARLTGTGQIRQVVFRSRTYSIRPVEFMLLIPIFVVFASFNPTRTSSMLFSPRTVAAIERGVDRELIAESDANRLVVTSSGLTGEVSVWKRAGNVYEFQKNGVSLGKVSTNTALSPQPAEDVLPAIMGLVSHPQPKRVLVLGDDTGVCLRSCCHFPVPEIIAIRTETRLTELARRFTWIGEETPADRDPRVRIVHAPEIVALQDRQLKSFDVVVAASNPAVSMSGTSQFTIEYYEAVQSRLAANGVFCQRFRQQGLGPDPVKVVMSTMASVFNHVGIVQTVPGEILLFATDNQKGLIDPEILSRLQRDHVRQEIASTGLDWSQVAILPLLDVNDPVGVFSHDPMPRAMTITNGGFALTLPLEHARSGSKNEETRTAFAPFQMQLLSAIPVGENHEEVKRRLTALAQQTEILAGMPDQPWTYRKSLRMEMQRSPRPPQEVVENGNVVKTAHPLDVFNREYFETLGKALTAATESRPATLLIQALERFTQNPEPLLSHFAHYEIVRLYEMTNHPSPADEFRHRLHIVFFTTSSDASVRPVISAIEQLVSQPDLISDQSERYDMLNSLLQKLIERWEARTAWEPRSALRVQNDVDQSVRMTNRALDLMQESAELAGVEKSSFLRRRRYINAALIAPLRDYRDQVLAHRMKSEAPAAPDSEDPDDLPLLLKSNEGLNTN